MDIDEKYMTEALKEAQLAFEEDEIPIGAVIVCRGRIIARGHNMTERLHDPTAHAEMIAITQAAGALGSWRLEGCALYVTLEPCPMCAGAIINARIKTLVFGAYDGKAGSIDSVVRLCDYPYNHKPEIYGGIMEDECTAVMQDFFKKIRNKNLSF